MRTDGPPGFRGPTTDAGGTTMVEPCECCDNETVHEVFVHVFVESARAVNVKFSRQPYRVSVCTECGEETLSRMNHS